MQFDDSEPPAEAASDPPAPKAQPLDAQQKTTSANTDTASPATNAAAAEPPALPPANASAPNAAAGVSTSSAFPNAETITVNLYELMESGNTKNNITLQSGDVVTVPHAGIVYVLGAVGRPGGFVLTNDREQMTTLKILALAGGFTATAKSSHAVIIRKDAQGKQHEVDVDLKKIRDRQAEDLQLQPSDILYVPSSGAKQALLRSVEFGLALGSGVALYRLAYH
jgi:polysaccharide export outer membrane protein